MKNQTPLPGVFSYKKFSRFLFQNYTTMHRRKLSFRPSRSKLQKLKEIESRLFEYNYNPDLDSGSNLKLFGNLLRTPARVNDLHRVPSLVDDLE